MALYYLHEGTNLQYVYNFCEEQLAQFNHDLTGIPSAYLGMIGELLAMAGGREKIEDILVELKGRINTGSEDTPYLAIALIYNALGESEKAIDYLEKGVEIREPFIYIINFRPTLEALRSNKRYQDLLVRLGFEVRLLLYCVERAGNGRRRMICCKKSSRSQSFPLTSGYVRA